jgi:hypothetical protein
MHFLFDRPHEFGLESVQTVFRSLDVRVYPSEDADQGPGQTAHGIRLTTLDLPRYDFGQVDPPTGFDEPGFGPSGLVGGRWVEPECRQRDVLCPGDVKAADDSGKGKGNRSGKHAYVGHFCPAPNVFHSLSTCFDVVLAHLSDSQGVRESYRSLRMNGPRLTPELTRKSFWLIKGGRYTE